LLFASSWLSSLKLYGTRLIQWEATRTDCRARSPPDGTRTRGDDSHEDSPVKDNFQMCLAIAVRPSPFGLASDLIY
jgi:hypothetical protein